MGAALVTWAGPLLLCHPLVQKTPVPWPSWRLSRARLHKCTAVADRVPGKAWEPRGPGRPLIPNPVLASPSSPFCPLNLFIPGQLSHLGK